LDSVKYNHGIWPFKISGVARNLLGGGGAKQEVWETEVPQRGREVQRQSPGGSVGANPPETGDIYRMHNKENKQKYTTLLYIFAYFLYYTSSVNRHTIRLQTRKHRTMLKLHIFISDGLSLPITH